MAEGALKTSNHDIAGLCARIKRFAYEVYKSQSSGVADVREGDVARIGPYLDAVDRYHEWVIAQPQLDLPETTPKEIAIEALPDYAPVENENINDLLRLFKVLHDELALSQSTNIGSGLSVHDSTRLTKTVAKARAFLKDYVVPTAPLDLPESSPKRPSSGSGRTVRGS